MKEHGLAWFRLELCNLWCKI